MKLFPLMMQQTKSTSGRRAFTLIELVIVLAVASLLFAGLWRLLSGGNATIRDQAAADLQIQITNAIKAYMNTPEGQELLTAQGPNGIMIITLPTANWATVNDCRLQYGPLNPTPPIPQAAICEFLPNGFHTAGANPTTNSYSQTFLDVNVRKDGTGANTPANSYSFMVVTTGGDVIPDTSGGRIASNIGNDGGFIYSDTNVCGAPIEQFACGAFGTWDENITTYNYAPGVGGRIASRTFVNAGTNTSPWLARVNIPTSLTVTPPGTPDFNTLQANTHMNGTASFNLQGSPLNMQGGTINGGDAATTSAGSIGTISNVNRIFVGNLNDRTNPQLVVNGPANGLNGTGASYLATCGTGVGGAGSACAFNALVNGNARVSGMLYANFLYANSFVYDTSDARLKREIQPLDNPLAKLDKIRAVSYIKSNEEKVSFGVIAQEVEKVYPELVYKIGDDFKAVDYIGMIGPLLGAVKQLKHENEELRSALTKQNEKIDLLEKKMSR